MAGSSSPSVAPIIHHNDFYLHSFKHHYWTYSHPAESDGCASKSHFLSAVDYRVQMDNRRDACFFFHVTKDFEL